MTLSLIKIGAFTQNCGELGLKIKIGDEKIIAFYPVTTGTPNCETKI
jgi:hypothetical protein